tara:strand:- start:3103 stop:4056 length:954 start_codon:yes stop_codon:yes gene_type:complete
LFLSDLILALPRVERLFAFSEMADLNSEQISAFMHRHQLPKGFHGVIKNHYLPLSDWLRNIKQSGTEIFAISGAQGTGKTTLAKFLKLALRKKYDWSVARLSLDDFYFTRSERKNLGKNIHPLLSTRGAPGTHDLNFCIQTLTKLRKLKKNETLKLPRFDKSIDDRLSSNNWPTVSGPIDAVIFEGWCLGSEAQADTLLSNPINELEEKKDVDATWRTYVNNQLRNNYPDLFQLFDKLIFLQAPNISAVHHWRQEQETKLAQKSHSSKSGIMDTQQINKFIQHYERITRSNIDRLPKIADVTMVLGTNHQILNTFYR